MLSRELVLVAIVSSAVACGNVAAPRNAECGAQVLPNGGFDAATPAWVQMPASPSLLCNASTAMPVSDPNFACLGQVDGSVETLTQPIPLPAGVTKLTLSGQICISTKDSPDVDHDFLQFSVLDGTTTIATLGQKTNRDGAAMCGFAQFPAMTAMVTSDPVEATFQIQSTLDASTTGTTVTSFFLDDLTLTASCTE